MTTFFHPRVGRPRPRLKPRVSVARSWPALLLALMLLAGPACNPPAQAETQPGATDSQAMTADRPAATSATLTIHYHRADGDYDGWNVWLWPDGGEGRAIPFDGRDAFGRIATATLDLAGTPGGDPLKVGFIVRKGDWEAKDVDRDRHVELSPPTPGSPGSSGGPGKPTAIWLNSGDETIYTAPGDVDLTPRLLGAFLDASDTLTVASTASIAAAAIRKSTLRVGDASVKIRDAKTRDRSGASGAGRMVYAMRLAEGVSPEAITQPMVLEVEGFAPVTVKVRDVLDDERFDASGATLGPSYTASGTTFRAWSPVSESAEVLLYEHGINAEPSRVLPMRRVDASGGGGGEGEGEVWEVEVQNDLHNVPYQLRFTSYGQERTVADIHAFAALDHSNYSVVVDLNRTDPDGWEQDQSPPRPHPTDEILYEVHVRDFSMTDPACPPEYRGKYLGLTTINPASAPGSDGTPGKPSTGLSHLKDLGITAVHLLPIHDFGNGGDLSSYNWGYWTTLFNVPEESYSTTPGNPANTIRELKQTIQTLHSHGIRVILDVVYNHTSSSFEHSAFDQTVPWYYFRSTPDGKLRNDAGVGNSIADERAMVRDYILDSLKFWVREYHIDGFRFDLLGTHHPETVREIAQELYAIRPDLTIYGEPWTGGGPTYFPKGAQKNMGVAVFNDHLRNAVRGDLDGTTTGFATGPGGDVPAVKRGVMGAIDDFAADPTETINYVEAHDNRTFWDKLGHTHPNASDAEKRAMQKLALGIVLTSQGIPFLHGGMEMARTKGGHHNSYNAGDEVNAFGWDRKQEYEDVYDYTRGLIALRKAHPAFRMHTAEAVRKNLKFLEVARDKAVVAYTLDGEAAGDGWDEIVVAYNGEPTEQTVTLPGGAWNVVVDAERAGVKPLREARGDIVLPGYSMVVVAR